MEGEVRETVCMPALDSLLQKAGELESSLRAWREQLGSAGTHERGSSAASRGGEGAPQQPVQTVQHTPSPAASPAAGEVAAGRGSATVKEGGRGDGAWQQVMAYIVQLEKRVREMEQSASPEESRGERRGRGMAEAKGGSQEAKQLPVFSQTPQQDEVVEKEIREAKRLVQTDGGCQALLLVFRWLNCAELCTVSTVNRQWRAVSHHPDLWRCLSLSEVVLSSQNLCWLARWCGTAEAISLHGLMPEMAGPDEELHSYIARQKGSLEQGLAHLLSAAPQLTRVSVTECNLMVTERLLWLCSVHCPLLRQFTYTSDEFPPTPEALWSLSNGCTQLQSLHLPPYLGSPLAEYFNDVCLSSIATGWPHLLHLTVGGPGITVAGLSQIVRFCPWLEELSVAHGPQLSSSDVLAMTAGGGLGSLLSLSLSFTPISPKALHLLTASCPCLSSLTLHVSLNTYFPGSPDAIALNKYHRILDNLKELQQRPQLKGSFHLHQHSLNSSTVI